MHPPAPETWHHSMKNLTFHSLLRWGTIVLLILATSLIHFSLKVWENVLFELGCERSEQTWTWVEGQCRVTSTSWWGCPTPRHVFRRPCSITNVNFVYKQFLTFSLHWLSQFWSRCSRLNSLKLKCNAKTTLRHVIVCIRCWTMPKFQWKNRLSFRDIYVQIWQNHLFPIISRDVSIVRHYSVMSFVSMKTECFASHSPPLWNQVCRKQ